MKILFLDDNNKRAEFFLQYNNATWTATAQGCIACLEADIYDCVYLDHDLDGKVYVDSNSPRTGMEVVRYLINDTSRKHKDTIFIIHSWNMDAANLMLATLINYDYKAIYLPYVMV